MPETQKVHIMTYMLIYSLGNQEMQSRDRQDVLRVCSYDFFKLKHALASKHLIDYYEMHNHASYTV